MTNSSESLEHTGLCVARRLLSVDYYPLLLSWQKARAQESGYFQDPLSATHSWLIKSSSSPSHFSPSFRFFSSHLAEIRFHCSPSLSLFPITFTFPHHFHHSPSLSLHNCTLLSKPPYSLLVLSLFYYQSRCQNVTSIPSRRAQFYFPLYPGDILSVYISYISIRYPSETPGQGLAGKCSCRICMRCRRDIILCLHGGAAVR